MSETADMENGGLCYRWEAPSITPGAGRPRQNSARELAEIEEHARKEGREAGYREGLAAARDEIKERARRLDDLIAALADPLAAIDESVERQLVTLALAVAKQLIRRELSQQPDEIVAVVREAVAALPPTGVSVDIHVHPEDARLLRETLSIQEEQSPWRLHEDAGISRGGCRVSSGYAEADAQLETRMQELASRLLGGDRSSDGGLSS